MAEEEPDWASLPGMAEPYTTKPRRPDPIQPHGGCGADTLCGCEGSSISLDFTPSFA